MIQINFLESGEKIISPTPNAPQQDVSVIAYPMTTGQHKMERMNSCVSGANGADPTAMNLNLPPTKERILPKMTLSTKGVS